MIELTEVAEEKMRKYLAENKIESPVRIFVMGGGCSGPSLGLALDEQKEGDMLIDKSPILIVINKELADSCGRIKVDFVTNDGSACGCGSGGGFKLSSAQPLPGSGGGCGGSCSSSGCGC